MSPLESVRAVPPLLGAENMSDELPSVMVTVGPNVVMARLKVRPTKPVFTAGQRVLPRFCPASVGNCPVKQSRKTNHPRNEPRCCREPNWSAVELLGSIESYQNSKPRLLRR